MGLPVRYMEVPGISQVDACNLAAQESGSEYIAFLNDGCMPHPDWLNAFRKALEAWNLGVVGGSDLPSKSAGFLGRSLHYVLTSFAGSLGLRVGSEYAGRYYPRRWNMAARREAVRLSGGFSDLHPACPEVPMISRMGKIGYRAGFEESAWVRRSRDVGLLDFIAKSYRMGLERGRGCLQPGLPTVYAAALALLGLPALLTLVPATRSGGMLALSAVVLVYAVIVLVSSLHAVWAARTPLALVAVPMLTIAHHALHVVGYVIGRFVGWSIGRIAGRRVMSCP
jgi:hypothetical protein